MDKICKMYRKQALFGFAVYAAVAFVAMWAVEKYPLGEWRIPVALAPIMPAPLFACFPVAMSCK
ncbi:MAG TPA: hypothetical protein VMV98_04460 [Acidobacteriaceae bacterium]|nr:hypothetical protein [Acidobacteriaceae bacterium]